MRKILITNDDGISSDGLMRLAETAKKYGEVWVIAPDGQRSATSHKITLDKPVTFYEVKDYPVKGIKVYKSTGSPADCVRIGLLNFVKADVVFSGINFGYNCGSDIQYSGTANSALEAAHTGVHAIAFSEGADGVHEVTDAYLDKMMAEYIDKPLKHNQIWNINFPECKLADFKGILTERKVAKNAFYIDRYDTEELPDGGLKMSVNGVYHRDAPEGTDFEACIKNCISVGIVNNIS